MSTHEAGFDPPAAELIQPALVVVRQHEPRLFGLALPGHFLVMPGDVAAQAQESGAALLIAPSVSPGALHVLAPLGDQPLATYVALVTEADRVWTAASHQLLHLRGRGDQVLRARLPSDVAAIRAAALHLRCAAGPQGSDAELVEWGLWRWLLLRLAKVIELLEDGSIIASAMAPRQQRSDVESAEWATVESVDWYRDEATWFGDKRHRLLLRAAPREEIVEEDGDDVDLHLQFMRDAGQLVEARRIRDQRGGCGWSTAAALMTKQGGVAEGRPAKTLANRLPYLEAIFTAAPWMLPKLADLVERKGMSPRAAAQQMAPQLPWEGKDPIGGDRVKWVRRMWTYRDEFRRFMAGGGYAKSS